MPESRPNPFIASLLLASIVMVVINTGYAQTASPTPAQPFQAALQPYIGQSVAGAVAFVATKDKVIHVETLGYSDLAKKTPIRADDVFWIASMTKSFTATALMILVDEGKLSLDDPVEKYIPEFKGQMVLTGTDHHLVPSIHPVTIRNILSHTSGLQQKSPEEEKEHNVLDIQTLKDRAADYGREALMFQPGQGYFYTNAGPNTAARIIEIVSGEPYQQFLEERLIKPLGLKDTTFWPNAAQMARLVKNYKTAPNGGGLEEIPISQLSYPLDNPKRQPLAAGGLFSTAADITRFCQMILNGGVANGKRILSEAAINEMAKRETPLKDPEGKNYPSYGLGWATDGVNIQHGGALGTFMWVKRAHGIVDVLMIQHANPNLPPLNEFRTAYQKTAAQFDHPDVIPAVAAAPPAPVQLNQTVIQEQAAVDPRREERKNLRASVTSHLDITYSNAGGIPEKLDVYVPVNASGALPLVIFIHGGGWSAGAKGNNNTRALFLAQHGYVVSSIDYRLSGQAAFPAQIEDCKSAIRWLRANAAAYHIDPDRIGVWGSSAGGHLVALLGTTDNDKEFDIGDNITVSSRVQAVCDFFGPTDLLEFNVERQKVRDDGIVAKLLGGPVDQNAQKAAIASPINHVSKDAPPFLIAHGDNDKGVSISQSREFYAALQKAGVPAELDVIPGGGHGEKGWPDVNGTVLAFFDKNLKSTVSLAKK